MRRFLLSQLFLVMLYTAPALSQERPPSGATDRSSEEPQSPILLAARSQGEAGVTLYWQPAAPHEDIIEYRLYRQVNGGALELCRQYSPEQLSGLQVETDGPCVPGQSRCYQMTSVTPRRATALTEPSQLLVVLPGQQESPCLVVLDRPAFRRESGDEVPLADLLAQSLQEADRSFDMCLSEACSVGDSTPIVSLLDYKMVLWSCAPGVFKALDVAERKALQNYLDHEGRLFLNACGLDRDLTTADEIGFYQSYLKAFHANGLAPVNASQGLLVGASDSPFFETIQVNYRVAGSSREATGITESIRPLEPYGGSDAVLYFGRPAPERVAAVAYVGNYGTPNSFSRMVYLGFPWEWIPDAGERTELLKAVIRYLERAGPLKFVGVISGVVTDAQTGQGLDGARVRLVAGTNYLGAPVGSTADEHGRFKFIALEGTYHLSFEKPGYETQLFRNVSVRKDKTRDFQVALVPAEPE